MKWIYRISGIVSIVTVWGLLHYFHIVSALVLPSPTEVLFSLMTAYQDIVFWQDIFYTILRTLTGFSIGTIAGILIGLLMGYSEKMYDMLEFIVDFFRSIPATALFPLFMIAFGIEDGSKVALAAWTCALVMTVNTMSGVHSAKQLRIKAAKTLHIRGITLLRKIIFPEALPHIAAGARIALSLALIVIIVTEMFIGTNEGLGKRITEKQQIFAIADIYVAIITTGLIGYALNRCALAIEKRTLHWHGK